ncbi:MAG: SH3 domain-containing protein [Bdellovibrionia bacterium]
MKLIFALLSLFLVTETRAAQKGVVVTEGAIVYRKADFDSPVVGYFQRGRKVAISTKRFGAFFRVKFKQGLMGYISDVDVSFDGKGKMPDAKNPKDPKDAKDPEAREREKAARAKKSPPWQATAVGPFAGYIQFTELISQAELSSKLMGFGLQFSMPFTLLDGPFALETTFLYHSGAPSYYDQVSSTPADGTILFLDSVLTFPLSNFDGVAGALSVGAGPLINQSSITATLSGTQKDLKETKLGISIVGGASYRLSRLIFKAEAKYFVEKASYLGFVAGVQYVLK